MFLTLTPHLPASSLRRLSRSGTYRFHARLDRQPPCMTSFSQQPVIRNLRRFGAVMVSSLFALLSISSVGSTVHAADEDGIRFFEQKIRPVLVQQCYSCHSAQAREDKKLQGGLYLDSAAGIAAGGESGDVLVKGNPDASNLLKALRYDGLEMPPSGKLPDEVIADFAHWIQIGAPDPRSGEAPLRLKREIDIAQGKQWWSFQPLQKVSPPDATRPIDSFIQQAQHAQGLKPNHRASKEKLLRRVYLDLIGLPPTLEQLTAFMQDESPQAFERVVDQLLASEAYGERWARHWLDAVRFAESGGYEFDGFRPGAYHYRDWVIRAWNQDLPYDQFVRMQLAGDLLTPDTLEGAAATGFLVAGPYPGQITAKTVERIRYDQIDDMMMTIGGSMLGLTLGCVRCHEHKYDPIPHQDYYSLAASLARTVHGNRTLDFDPEATERAWQQYQAEHEPLVTALRQYAADKLPTRFEAWRSKELNSLPETARWQTLEPVTWHAERSYLKAANHGLLIHDGLISPGAQVRQRGQRRSVGNEETYRLTFHTHQKNLQAIRLDAFADKSLPQRGPGLNGDGSFQLAEIKLTAQPLDPQAKEAPQTVKLKPVFAAFEDANQPLTQAVDEKPNTAWVVKTTAKQDNAAILELETPIAGFANGTELVLELKFRDLGLGRLRVSLSVEPNPATWAGNVADQHGAELKAVVAAHGQTLPEPVRESLVRWFAPFDAETASVLKTVRDHEAAQPRPRFTQVYTTIAGGQDLFFLRRGEVDNKQGKAQAGFLQVLYRRTEPNGAVTTGSEPAAGVAVNASGSTTPSTASPDIAPAAVAAPTDVDPRLALANWMTDLDHGAGPLLARVIANRIWQHHLGKGLVATPNDFGVQGERPTHPELLEYLASELVHGGWKLKSLHRLILLSETYQQSHEVDPENLQRDPNNRYLWHYRPRRLEAETIRDTLLAVSGNLDSTRYGASVLDNSPRRSVYLRVKRSELLPIMTTFDAPEPTQSIGERSVTTVPTQALVMMNSPFVRQQAEKLMTRVRPAAGETFATVVERTYQMVLSRKPTETESQRMVAFIEQQIQLTENDPATAQDRALVEFCHVLLCLNEFVYVD